MFRIRIYRSVPEKIAKSGRKLVLSDVVDSDDIGKAVAAINAVVGGASEEQRAAICRVQIDPYTPKTRAAKTPDFG